MGSKDIHFKLYKKFKNDAENLDNFEGTRVEAYFLSAYHLIESCAAKERVHINKHQYVRSILTQNTFIFQEDTKTIWTNFQKIENQLRPKFAYGFTWNDEDMKTVEKCYSIIEKLCLKKMEVSSNE
jgi:hypothetical protein